MHRFVLEPVLFAIFGELLYPFEPVEYLMPYSTVLELYELVESEEIVTDPAQNVRVKEHIKQLIEFFEQPLVKKKMERALRVPWQKSAPILFSEQVKFTVVFALDNAEYGEAFDPIETELLLLAKRENAPIISDQLSFQQHVVEHKVPVTVIDVADFGFFVENDTFEDSAAEELLMADLLEQEALAAAPLASYEAQEGALPASPRDALQQPAKQPAKKKEKSLLPIMMGLIVLILLGSLITLFR